MAITVPTVIAEARGLLQDTTAPYRYSDADLTQYMNDCLDLLVDYLPQLFHAYSPLICVAGAKQSISSAVAKRLLSVLRVTNGQAVVTFDRDAMDNFDPKWRTKMKSGATTEWAAIDDLTFEVLPPAPAGQQLDVQYVAVPQEYKSTDTLDARLTPYTNLLVDYMVGMAEAREAEEAGPVREQLFIAQFVNKVKGAVRK